MLPCKKPLFVNTNNCGQLARMFLLTTVIKKMACRPDVCKHSRINPSMLKIIFSLNVLNLSASHHSRANLTGQL